MWQIVINGPRYFDATLFLPEGTTTIGRSSENDIVLTGSAVSRHHAQLEAKGDDLYVVDLGSRNGCQVNGQVLKGTALLRPGDVISVGENSLTVRRPARVENAFAPNVDPGAGGIKRLSPESSPEPQVVGIQRPGSSQILKSLDEFVPDDPISTPGIPSAYRSLILLQETAERVDSAGALQDFLDEAIDWAREKLGCPSGVILLKHPGGALVPVALRRKGDGVAQGEVLVADNIVFSTFERRSALAVTVGQDGTRGGKVKGSVGGGDQVLCAPIGTPERFIGALYLSRNGQPDEDLDVLLDVCNALARFVAQAVERYQRQARDRRGDRLRQALERFHAPDILEKRSAELSRSGGNLTQMERRRITVLCADIADFTALVSALPPDQVVDLLNEFYARMTSLIFSFEGTVDKFMGDSVLALFGAPYPHEDDAVRAVRCAQAMRSEWTKAMNRRPAEQRRGLQIGLSTGEVLVGTVGSEARLDFTAIGLPVNQAAWICRAAERGQILICEETFQEAGSRFNVLRLGEQAIARDKRKLDLFEVYEEDDSRMDTQQVKKV